MSFRSLAIFLLLAFFSLVQARAAEFSDGAIRLVLNEDNGRFSLYSARHQNNRRRPLALFFDQDPRTSFLSVMINDRSHVMGDSSVFQTRLGQNIRVPSLILESPLMMVTKEFHFIRSPNSTETNGVFIFITLENLGEHQISAGARFLLDTNLSEQTPAVSFRTNRRTADSEALLTAADGDSFWTDRNDVISLTGSLFGGSPGLPQSFEPDSVHFANWKKLSDAVYRAHFQPGRNFNLPPFSFADAAVCYYYEPKPLGRGEKRSFGFTLVLNDESVVRVSAVVQEQDMLAIRELLARIDTLISLGTASEEELETIELALGSLRAKYGYSSDFR